MTSWDTKISMHNNTSFWNWSICTRLCSFKVSVISTGESSMASFPFPTVARYSTPPWRLGPQWFQGCHTCSSVAVWKFCVILSWWLSSCHRRSWATNTLHREPDMRRYPDPQHLWWQSFCSCRFQAMEQFTATSQRCRLTVQSVPAVTKDIFVG